MADYIAKSIVYPEQARTDEVEGKVFVQFIVEPDGSIGDVTLLRGIGGGCDEEALRVIKAMPQWKPARFKGKPARSRFQTGSKWPQARALTIFRSPSKVPPPILVRKPP